MEKIFYYQPYMTEAKRVDKKKRAIRDEHAGSFQKSLVSVSGPLGKKCAHFTNFVQILF